MFHTIPPAMQAEMTRLERLDARDRVDGTPRLERLRQIPPIAGKLLAILAANTPEGDIVEIGASAGYSALWLALACRAVGRKITTYEILEEKVALATATFRAAGVSDLVTLIAGDARDYLPGHERIAFCFLDAEKGVYGDCYDAVIPNLVQGGLLVADNASNHQEILQPMLDRAAADERVDSLIDPLGNGFLICRKI